MNGFSPEFETKLASIGLRPNRMGIAMAANISGVEVTASESPLAIHLTFTRITERTATQYEVEVPTESTAQQIASVIVENIESNFSDVIKETSR